MLWRIDKWGCKNLDRPICPSQRGQQRVHWRSTIWTRSERCAAANCLKRRWVWEYDRQEEHYVPSSVPLRVQQIREAETSGGCSCGSTGLQRKIKLERGTQTMQNLKWHLEDLNSFILIAVGNHCWWVLGVLNVKCFKWNIMVKTWRKNWKMKDWRSFRGISHQVRDEGDLNMVMVMDGSVEVDERF